MYDLNPPRNSSDESPLSIPSPATPAEEFSARLHAFTPYVYVTPALIGINVLVYLIMIINGVDFMEPKVDALLRWGADFGPTTLTAGQWWRMFTSMFLHIGLIHIAFNMFVLFQAGPFVERLLGNVTFLVVYLVSGLTGALASLAWNPYVVSAGASGAIFGVYGALLGFLLLSRNDTVPPETVGPLTRSALIFLGYNVIYGVLNKGTDLAAHAGGLVGGFICGAVLSTPLTLEHRRSRYLRTAAIAVASAVFAIASFASLPRPVDMRARLQEFTAVEKRTLAAFNADLRRSRTEKWKDEQLADLIEKQVLPDWTRERDSLARLTGLPAKQQQFVTSLVSYMDLRRQGWTMLAAGLRKHDVTAVRRANMKQQEAVTTLQASMSGVKQPYLPPLDMPPATKPFGTLKTNK